MKLAFLLSGKISNFDVWTKYCGNHNIVSTLRMQIHMNINFLADNLKGKVCITNYPWEQEYNGIRKDDLHIKQFYILKNSDPYKVYNAQTHLNL